MHHTSNTVIPETPLKKKEKKKQKHATVNVYFGIQYWRVLQNQTISALCFVAASNRRYSKLLYYTFAGDG